MEDCSESASREEESMGLPDLRGGEESVFVRGVRAQADMPLSVVAAAEEEDSVAVELEEPTLATTPFAAAAPAAAPAAAE